MIQQFQQWAASRADPACDHVFVLVKFNIFRAMSSNALILGIEMDAALSDDALSPFSPPIPPFPSPIPAQQNTSSVPPSLRPTILQMTVSHHPWIDLLPVPQLRDNLISAGDEYDEEALCEDLCGFCSGVDVKSGLIVWDSPWEPRGWELTPEFVAKWGWVAKGCGEMMVATNYWRVKRGERKLDFERIGSC